MPRNLYNGRDPRDVPTYGIREAAHYLRLPRATLHQWVSGGSHRRSVITPAQTAPPVLSFWNLVEAYVLAGITRHHRVPLRSVRRALNYVEEQSGLDRPLINQDFLTDRRSLFVEQFGRLVNASKQGQVAMRRLLDASLERIERDPQGLALRLFPWSGGPEEERAVEIDPRRSFGRLVIAGTGVPTAVIAGRMRAGESIEHLARDYKLPQSKIEAAVRWELGVQAH